jgi:hypothetical protein
MRQNNKLHLHRKDNQKVTYNTKKRNFISALLPKLTVTNTKFGYYNSHTMPFL